MSNCSKGLMNERERITFYEAEGWRLLQRSVRTRFQREDIGGAWDLWLVKDHAWLFVQVCDYHNVGVHREKCKKWLHENSLITFPSSNGAFYVLTVYRDAHFEGRGKNKKWVKKTWRTEWL